MSRYNYSRRRTRPVMVGNVGVGGDNPVRLQSMTNTSTMDTLASADQIERIADAGGEIVRLTTQGIREAANMAEIEKELKRRGRQTPLVADVHFNPKAAYTAAENCEKVRINPGNFVDVARTFRQLQFTDEEYAEEIGKIRRALLPLLDTCRRRHVALRLGVNHGSLSDRIMSRYGDTPAGMTESVMEFLRICRQENFHDIVISVKASNPCVMVDTVKMLVAAMEAEQMDYPIHLGVTEAGDAEDGRIKSAVGIGALMALGIGDTIRVSLSEDPEREIPVAAFLRDYIASRQGHPAIQEPAAPVAERIARGDVEIVGYDKPTVSAHCIDLTTADPIPDAVSPSLAIRLTSRNPNQVGDLMAYADRLRQRGMRNKTIMRVSSHFEDPGQVQLAAAADFGALLLEGYGDAVELDAPFLTQEQRNQLMLNILQATRRRITKTEYIACPGCGRTLFDLQQALRQVKEATAHLKGVKIAVMGCIVNGPGEMADADYGYVGAAAGKVSLYKGKECLRKNIPQEEALDALISLLKEEGVWADNQTVEK